PTNHLDIASKNVLKQALSNFEGTLILVSHDRDFLQGLTNKVYEFKDGSIKEYLGDIDYYLTERQVADFRAIEQKEKPKEEKKKTDKQDYQRQKELKSLNNRLSKIESRIGDLEKKIADQDHELLMNYDATAANPKFFDSYQNNKKELESLMSEWEKVSSQLD
ncbi:MAG: ABC-F family ATP-binding cassette domain-containing protein, partial [Flavobacteriaceae bacterium]|nr:ABC-F family ATP-binding cassette domain-containing protein [Flavobacteriaceae bacterium]